MRLLIRLLIVAALAAAAWMVFAQYREMSAIPVDDPRHDPSRVVTLFLMLLGLGIAAGVMFALSVLPLIGDQIGQFFYAPGQEVEKSPHAPALAAVARGDFEAAAAAYRAVLDQNPGDTHAISETTRLLCEKLGRPEEAVAFLEEQLNREWGMDDLAFVANRLVDVAWNYQRDLNRSRELLQQLVDALPDTRHSANAGHRLREIQREFEALPAEQRPAEEPTLAPETESEEELTIEFLSGPDAAPKRPPKA
jgi:tetratricopeptide (TPR) repeat protein